ncbi:hypothetical protein FISHEDRAFT_53890 [Fistulina hepatica ATCC 64428]|uniref:Arf-GAP domain-containing protein n=1 Tax=Fistulina hepatica ATCC 64428 TaxID=1128425 RepID=A0A0D7A039_9AGAR|nr:hypothetical protein FISHEDRAFT_53890 [Fistulina hepatica ATCC 64428]
MESFIRSKYESRRWAMNGPPPSDPSILENGAESTQHTPTEASPPASRRSTSVPTTARTVAPVHRIQPQPHRLISTGLRNQTAPALALAAPVPAAPAAVPSAANELFSLDFHSPPQSAATPESQQQQPQQDVKNNILSLFSTPSPIPPAGFGGASVGGAFGGSTSSTFGQFGAAAVQSQTASPWATATSAQPLQQTTSMMGSNGTGMWGASSGWTMPQSMQQQQPNVWSMNGAAAVQQQQGLFESSSIWSSVASAPATTSAPDPFGSFSTAQAAAAVTASKQDDTFGDLWGGFK